jgi:hypothetical protein
MKGHLPKLLFFGTLVLLPLIKILSLTLGFGAIAEDGGVRVTMQVILSLIVLAAALYVILSKKYEDAAQKWAYGAIGMILGFWLPQ